jgi:hypothetical protein
MVIRSLSEAKRRRGTDIVRRMQTAMASKTESDTRYWRMRPAVPVPAQQSSHARQWFRVWRWPAGLVVVLVLWLALVAVVGAGTRVGSPASRVADCHGLAAPTYTTIMHMS